MLSYGRFLFPENAFWPFILYCRFFSIVFPVFTRLENTPAGHVQNALYLDLKAAFLAENHKNLSVEVECSEGCFHLTTDA